MTELRLLRWVRRFRRHPCITVIGACAAQYGCRVFLVGGSLRDAYWGTPSRSEWDFAVSRNAVPLARSVAARLGGTCVVLDPATETARVVVGREGERYSLDFAAYKARTILGDVRRRDFTLNTLYCDVGALSGGDEPVVFDRCGAVADMRRRILRMTSAENLRSDPLRLLRGMVFCARFRLTPEAATKAALFRYRARLRLPAGERVREELIKLFSCPRATDAVRYMDELGFWAELIPELQPLRGLDQGGFHHLDVWRHSVETLAQLERLVARSGRWLPVPTAQSLIEYLTEAPAHTPVRIWLLKFACLLHDVGKPATRCEGAAGHVHFYSHERVGAHLAEAIARRLKCSGKEISSLSRLVSMHMRAGQLVNRRPSRRAVYRFFS